MRPRIRFRSSTHTARFLATLAALGLALPAAAADPDLVAMERALKVAAAGEDEVARKLAQQAVDACGPGMVSKPCRLATRSLLSRGFAMHTRYDLALEQAREAERLAGSTSHQARLSSLLILAGAAARAGELDEAEQAIADGRELAAKLASTAEGSAAEDLLKLRGMFGGPQALVFTARGQHVRAAASQRTLVDTMRSFDPDRAELAVETLALADLEAAASDPRAAREAYAEAIRLAEHSGDGTVRDKAQAGLARLDTAPSR